MTEFMISNPGSGPVDDARERDARRNIGAFCRDLGLPVPRIRVERCPAGDSDGRYEYLLHRGVREVFVDMPGIALARVRMEPGDNAWDFPRLYVDGSSWLWPFALNTARRALLDHDGSAERAYRDSVAAYERTFASEPRCAACGSIKERYLLDHEVVNVPYGLEALRCLTCIPIEKVTIKSWDCISTYIGDSWKRLRAGCVYRVTERRMPYEAIGGDADPICTRGYYASRQCRLRRDHEGLCQPMWKEISRERIDLPYRGDP